MKNIRGCAGTRQLNERNAMCRNCPFLKECKKMQRTKTKDWLLL